MGDKRKGAKIYDFDRALDLAKIHRTAPVGDEVRLQAYRAAAMEMRACGATFEEIGEALEVSAKTASNYVKHATTELCRLTTDSIENLRALECTRLDKMFFAHFHKACKGDTWSTDRCLMIMERRSKYLGLDKPIQHILSGDEDNPLTVEMRQKADEELLDLFRTLAGVPGSAQGTSRLPELDPAAAAIDITPVPEAPNVETAPAETQPVVHASHDELHTSLPFPRPRPIGRQPGTKLSEEAKAQGRETRRKKAEAKKKRHEFYLKRKAEGKTKRKPKVDDQIPKVPKIPGIPSIPPKSSD